MKLKFIQAINISFLCSFPVATLIASCILDLFVAVFNLSVYFFLSTNFKGSFELRLASSSLNLLSNNIISEPSIMIHLHVLSEILFNSFEISQEIYSEKLI